MGDLKEAVTLSNSRTLPIREDYWSEDATLTLIDAWGNRYLELNRGNLRQKDWQDVADAVNALHGHSKKTHRTDVQCKNRIDTIKKRYKAEKARVVNGTLTSSWPFFERMDSLIGNSFPTSKNTPIPPLPALLETPPAGVPLMRKRPALEDDGGGFRRNYLAAAETDTDTGEQGGVGDGGEGARRLVRAIERFGEVYEKVEREKLRQMVDLEKQRMEFVKDLEMERMRMFTEMQIGLEKIRRGSANGRVKQEWCGSDGFNSERDY